MCFLWAGSIVLVTLAKPAQMYICETKTHSTLLLFLIIISYLNNLHYFFSFSLPCFISCTFSVSMCRVDPQSLCTKSTVPPSSPRRSDGRLCAATSARPALTLTGDPIERGRGLGTAPREAAQCHHRVRAPCGRSCRPSETAACWSS